MALVWQATRIVPHLAEATAVDKESLLVFEFMTAYNDLRQGCPHGDLRIHLSVEGSPDKVGATLLPEEEV